MSLIIPTLASKPLPVYFIEWSRPTSEAMARRMKTKPSEIVLHHSSALGFHFWPLLAAVEWAGPWYVESTDIARRRRRESFWPADTFSRMAVLLRTFGRVRMEGLARRIHRAYRYSGRQEESEASIGGCRTWEWVYMDYSGHQRVLRQCVSMVMRSEVSEQALTAFLGRHRGGGDRMLVGSLGRQGFSQIVLYGFCTHRKRQ